MRHAFVIYFETDLLLVCAVWGQFCAVLGVSAFDLRLSWWAQHTIASVCSVAGNLLLGVGLATKRPPNGLPEPGTRRYSVPPKRPDARSPPGTTPGLGDTSTKWSRHGLPELGF